MSRSSLLSALALCLLAVLVNLVRPTPSESSYMWTPAVRFTDSDHAARTGQMRWGKTGATYIHYVLKECTGIPGKPKPTAGCNGVGAIGVYLVIDSTLNWVDAWDHADTLSDPDVFRMSDPDIAVDQGDTVHVVHEIFDLLPYQTAAGSPDIGYQVSGRLTWDPDTAFIVGEPAHAGRPIPLGCPLPRNTSPRLFFDESSQILHLTYPYRSVHGAATTACPYCSCDTCDTNSYYSTYTWKYASEPETAWREVTYITDAFRTTCEGTQCAVGGADRILVDSTGTVHLWGREVRTWASYPDTMYYYHVWGTPPADTTVHRWQNVHEDTLDTWIEPGASPAGGDNGIARDLEGVADTAIVMTWSKTGGPAFIHEIRVNATYDTVLTGRRQLTPGSAKIDDELYQAPDGRWHYIYATSGGGGGTTIWHKYVTTGKDPYYATAATVGDPDDWSEPSPFTIDVDGDVKDGGRAAIVAREDSAWVTFVVNKNVGADTLQQSWFRRGWAIADTVESGQAATWSGLVSLDADFYVAPGGTLIVEEGTTVVMADSTDKSEGDGGKDPSLIEIIVEGTLLADGTASAPIEFRGTDTTMVNSWYGLRMNLAGTEWAGTGTVGAEDPLSSISHATIRNAVRGVDIENLVAPSLADVDFVDIGGTPPQDIYLDSTDVFVPWGVWDRSDPDSANHYVSQQLGLWDLSGGTNVIASNAALPALETSLGDSGKVDLIVQGKIFTSGAVGDTVFFRPETISSGGDDWGGLMLDYDAAGSVIEYADIGYASNPVFLVVPDSATTLRNSRVHDFADVGVWATGTSALGGVIESNTIERGGDIDQTLGLTGVFLDSATQMTVRDNKVDLSQLLLTSGSSAAIDVSWATYLCSAHPLYAKTTLVEGNWIIGPGTTVTAASHAGIRSTWTCAGSATNSSVDYVRNYIEQFNTAGIQLIQTTNVQADSNNVVNSLRSVDISRDSSGVLLGPVASFKANWWEVLDKANGTETVQTDNIQYTALGPSSSTLGDNGFMVADSSVAFMYETDAAAGTLVAEDCYWYLDESGSPHFLNTMQEWSSQIRKRLDPDSTQYDVWPVQSSDASPTYYKMAGPPSVGRALAGRGEEVVEERPPGERPKEGVARLALVPTDTYFSVFSGNPVRTSTVLELGVPEGMAGHYEVEVFSVTGRRVAVLVREALSPGTYRFGWSGLDASGNRVSSGIYFIRALGPGFRKTQKVTLLR